MDCFGTYFTHVQKPFLLKLTTYTHGAHKIHSGKTAKDLYLTTCTHGCKNKGVHTAKPFRVYRRGPWPRVQMRPLTACTDEAVTLATLARTIRVYLRPCPRTIRVYLRPQKARAQPTTWPVSTKEIAGLFQGLVCPYIPMMTSGDVTRVQRQGSSQSGPIVSFWRGGEVTIETAKKIGKFWRILFLPIIPWKFCERWAVKLQPFFSTERWGRIESKIPIGRASSLEGKPKIPSVGKYQLDV